MRTVYIAPHSEEAGEDSVVVVQTETTPRRERREYKSYHESEYDACEQARRFLTGGFDPWETENQQTLFDEK